MILPVIEVMQAIGYRRAIVLYGAIDASDKGMDEASVCGLTHCAELTEEGAINSFSFRPEDFGFRTYAAEELTPEARIADETRRFVALMGARENGARSRAAILNAGLIYYVAGRIDSIEGGVKKATGVFESGRAFNALQDWVQSQSSDPDKGMATLEKWV
jgi:anthranilate phosphoribosyltransferase